jgi:hypothetical protein
LKGLENMRRQEQNWGLMEKHDEKKQKIMKWQENITGQEQNREVIEK